MKSKKRSEASDFGPKRKVLLGDALRAGRMVLAPGAYDIPTARLIQHIGFEYASVSLSQTATVLGLPEHLATFTQLFEAARTVAKACDYALAVIVDAGAGFGGTPQVSHTVRMMESARISGISISDAIYPEVKIGPGRAVLSVGDYQARLENALKARTSPDFVVIGRTESLQSASKEEAVKRARAAVEVGVGAVMVAGVAGEEQHRYFRREIAGVPLQSAMGPDGLDVHQLNALGYQIVTLTDVTLRLALHAIQDLYSGIINSRRPPVFDPSQVAQHRELPRVVTRISQKEAVESETTGS